MLKKLAVFLITAFCFQAHCPKDAVSQPVHSNPGSPVASPTNPTVTIRIPAKALVEYKESLKIFIPSTGRRT